MPSVVRAIVEADRMADAGVTTTKRPPSDAPALSFGKFLEHYNAPPDRPWEPEVLRRLFSLVCMPQGWDSYSALSPRWDASMFALWVLGSVMRPRTPVPQVVPSSVGGIQLEWHQKDIDLEIHVSAPFEVETWFQDRRGGQPVAEELSNDFSALARPIEELTTR